MQKLLLFTSLGLALLLHLLISYLIFIPKQPVAKLALNPSGVFTVNLINLTTLPSAEKNQGFTAQVKSDLISDERATGFILQGLQAETGAYLQTLSKFSQSLPQPKVPKKPLPVRLPSLQLKNLIEQDNENFANYSQSLVRLLRPYVVVPKGLAKNAVAVIKVQLDNNRKVISAELIRSSGSAAYDASAQRAVLSAGKFPSFGEELPHYLILYFRP